MTATDCITPADYAALKGWKVERKGEWLSIKRCPFCAGGRHNDLHTFAIHARSGHYTCRRGKCGVKGSFYALQRHFGDHPQPASKLAQTTIVVEESHAPVYITPQVLPGPITKQAATYLRWRGFTQAVWERRKVGCDARGNIVLPYYEPDGAHVMNKFRRPRRARSGERKSWREPGGRPVLWGMELADSAAGPLVVTFGEYDALACDEAQVPNAVSIPSGDCDTTWIELCHDWLSPWREIIIWPDMDESGERALSVIVRALHDREFAKGSIRMVKPNGYKDANQKLQRVMNLVGRDQARREVCRSVERAPQIYCGLK